MTISAKFNTILTTLNY